SDEEGSLVVRVGAQDEGQAGPNPGVQTKGHVGSNSGDDAGPQPQSSHVVHDGPNLEHMDLKATDVSTQQNPEQIDEGFTATAYPNIQENLKLTVEEQPLQATATETTTTTTTTTTHPPPPQPQQSTIDSILIKHISELKQIMANLIQDNKHLEERLINFLLTWPKHEERRKGDMIHRKHHRVSTSSSTSSSTTSSQSDQSKSTAAPSSSKTTALAKFTAWTTTNTRLRSSVSLILEDLHMDDDVAPDEQVHSSDDEDIGNAHIPKYQMEEFHKLLTDSVDQSIIREMVPDQMWIEEECKYDIAAMYGISHWWFQRQRFYIDRHTSKGDHRAVQTHMWILSVVRIKVFSMYGYDYMKTIVLRRADLNEHIISERDFKYLYPSDFEDLQRVKDFQLGIKSYQTQLNLTKPRWDATGFKYKHDFTVTNSPRAVTFRDTYRVQMIMLFNEIHKFSDGTLHQIDEVLDYRSRNSRSTG
nr:hypothetical protein [Tanacetum cinerariifolium]